MAKTKQIGVRFDEELFTNIKNAGLADSPQKALNLYERSYMELIRLKIEINNRPENKERIENERKGIVASNKTQGGVNVQNLNKPTGTKGVPVNEPKTNETIDTTKINEKIAALTLSANSCADTKLGRLAKANYLKQIKELQKQ